MVICFNGYGQFNETIRTGRPGQSIGAFTLGKSIFQVQSGFDVFGSDTDGLSSSGYLSNTVMRFGLTETFEISALVEHKWEEIKTNGSPMDLTGWSAVDVGMRYHIYSGKGLVPNVGFQIRFRLPDMGGDYEIEQLAPRFLVVTSQALTEKITLITNSGASWDGVSGIPRGNYTINLSTPITNTVGVFIENYGSVFRSTWETYWDTGIAWLVTPDLQLDLYGGLGNNNNRKDHFVSLGVSWRTKRK